MSAKLGKPRRFAGQQMSPFVWKGERRKGERQRQDRRRKSASLAAISALWALSILASLAVRGQAAPPRPLTSTPQPQTPISAAEGTAPTRGLADPYVGKKKLLIWADVQTGFQHDDINHAMAVIEHLGRQSGTYVSVIRTDSELISKQPIVGRGTRYLGRNVNARNLNQYDAIFFLGAGEGTLDSQQKADLISFVRDDGKGLVIGHAGGVAFFDWPEWGNLIGGFMGSEFAVHPTPLIVEDTNFPGMDAFPKTFVFTDQFPVMKEPYFKGKVHTIIRVDWSRMTPEEKSRRPDGDIPVVFALNYGKGRVFNSGFGHPDETWDDSRIQKMYLEAIKWSMRITDAAIPVDNKD